MLKLNLTTNKYSVFIVNQSNRNGNYNSGPIDALEQIKWTIFTSNPSSFLQKHSFEPQDVVHYYRYIPSHLVPLQYIVHEKIDTDKFYYHPYEFRNYIDVGFYVSDRKVYLKYGRMKFIDTDHNLTFQDNDSDDSLLCQTKDYNTIVMSIGGEERRFELDGETSQNLSRILGLKNVKSTEWEFDLRIKPHGEENFRFAGRLIEDRDELADRHKQEHDLDVKMMKYHCATPFCLITQFGVPELIVNGQEELQAITLCDDWLPAVGERVLAAWTPGRFYYGRIQSVNNGQYAINYEDGTTKTVGRAELFLAEQEKQQQETLNFLSSKKWNVSYLY